MLEISARNTLDITVEELWEMFSHDNDGWITLVYDDGRVKTRTTLLKHARPAWEVHKHFPNLPLLKSHGLDAGVNKPLGSQANIQQLSAIYKDIWVYLQPDENNADEVYRLIEKFSEICMRACAKLYRMIARHYVKYSVTFDMRDYLEIANDPRLVHIKRTAAPTEEGISSIYRVLKDIFGDPNMQHNPICMSIQIGACRVNQAVQLFGCRGFATDVNLEAFKVPIMRSYFDGMRLLSDLVMGSRDMVLAAANTETPLKIVEYFNRSVQMLTGVLKNLHWGDCGTSKTLNWLVEERELPILVGKRYYDEDGNLTSFKGDEKHLVGRYVRLRSIFGQCAHPDVRGVCSTCYGDLSRSIVNQVCLGHSSAVNMFSPISQDVMGTKHLIASVNAPEIIIDEYHASYIEPDQSRYGYRLNPKIFSRYKQINLVLTPDQAPGLTDVVQHHDGSIEEWDMWRITTFTPMRREEGRKKKKPSHATLELIDEDGTITEVQINMTLNNTNACLDIGALKYVRQYGFATNLAGNFVINMGGWNPADLLVKIPMQHVDVLAFQQRIEEYLKKAVFDQYTGTPEGNLKLFLDILLQRAKPNFALVEATLLCFCVGDDGTAYVPKANRGTGGVTKLSMREAYNRRSIGPLFSYERQHHILTSPVEHCRKHRPSSPMDEFYLPQEVVDASGDREM